jgi:hypothetical protein
MAGISSCYRYGVHRNEYFAADSDLSLPRLDGTAERLWPAFLISFAARGDENEYRRLSFRENEAGEPN